MSTLQVAKYFLLFLNATLIEGPYPSKCNYLGGKGAPSLVLILIVCGAWITVDTVFLKRNFNNLLFSYW